MTVVRSYTHCEGQAPLPVERCFARERFTHARGRHLRRVERGELGHELKHPRLVLRGEGEVRVRARAKVQGQVSGSGSRFMARARARVTLASAAASSASFSGLRFCAAV